MTEQSFNLALLILHVGGLIILAILIKSGLKRISIPSLVGFMALGFFIRLIDSSLGILTESIQNLFEFLANVGIICLLFRVGLESNLAGLLKQLRRASFIWLGNVIFSGGLGFVTSFYIFGLSLIPSLFVAVALTATSVGISVMVWKQSHALGSPTGELLVDIAEMDDISGIVFMALLFSVVPVLKDSAQTSLLPLIARTSAVFLLKLLAFLVFCILFSRYMERFLAKFFKKIEPAPDPMLMVVAIGFIIASIAGLLGFSVAIGAFFAGLVFSRDPETVNMDASFLALYDLFTPFFFIGIGFNIDPHININAFGLAAMLFLVAIIGKAFGTAGPASMSTAWSATVLLSVSMVPRAEIAMVVMQEGLKLGEWAVPNQVFAAMVMVCTATCIISPIILRILLKRWPQQPEK
jgi:Kef-type K+ transport system membrane component KefB